MLCHVLPCRRVVYSPFYSHKIAIEAQHGLIAQVLKDVIFSMRPGASADASLSQATEVVDTAMSIG